MMLRSLLFVPGDAPDKMQKALNSGADAVVLDLEDSVALGAKPRARDEVAKVLQQKPENDAPLIIVRVNPLSNDNSIADDDLAAVMPYAPSMLMLPKALSGADVQWLGAKLGVHEAKNNLAVGETNIIAIAPEMPSAVFTLGTFAVSSERLKALTWGGGEDLSSEVGARTNRGEDGRHTEPYRLVRNLALFASASANIFAIDGVYGNFRDADGAKREAMDAYRDGFSGKLAIHPSQVAIFNEAFSPSAQDIDEAHEIHAAFNNAGEKAGVVNFKGRMLDRPHLARAERILAAAKAAKS
ncbi:MAG: CoA ester lyase [Pseudomonadota bacterium]